MYFYPDNITESILLFQKGKFNYETIKEMDPQVIESSTIDKRELSDEEWYLTVWNITNVLPRNGRLEEGIAAFPEEIPRRLIKLFTFRGETVLDPFLGSGTTAKVAKDLGRNSYGYELDFELKDVIAKKVGYKQGTLSGDIFEMIERKDSRALRTSMQSKVKEQKSVARA